MNQSLILPRIKFYSFPGGQYSIDMEENLGLRVPFKEPELIPGAPDSLYRTRKQREMYAEFLRRACDAHRGLDDYCEYLSRLAEARARLATETKRPERR